MKEFSAQCHEGMLGAMKPESSSVEIFSHSFVCGTSEDTWATLKMRIKVGVTMPLSSGPSCPVRSKTLDAGIEILRNMALRAKEFLPSTALPSRIVRKTKRHELAGPAEVG
jgi:hypothetical protein